MSNDTTYQMQEPDHVQTIMEQALVVFNLPLKVPGVIGGIYHRVAIFPSWFVIFRQGGEALATFEWIVSMDGPEDLPVLVWQRPTEAEMQEIVADFRADPEERLMPIGSGSDLVPPINQVAEVPAEAYDFPSQLTCRFFTDEDDELLMQMFHDSKTGAAIFWTEEHGTFAKLYSVGLPERPPALVLEVCGKVVLTDGLKHEHGDGCGCADLN